MKRLGLLGVSAVLLWCSTANAQLTTSTMFGNVTDATNNKPIEGAVVAVKSTALQGEQVGVSDSSGRFRITLLPPGKYSVHVEATGYKPLDQKGIVLELGKTIRVNVSVIPTAVTAKQVVVTAKATATVDQGSTTFGVLIDKDLLEKIPLGRTYESALLMTPGSTATDTRVPAGFGGATGLENTFIIDGLNVTDPARGYSTTFLPPEFLEQIEVKVGGYMPEFGRATGAVVNSIIKSGGNEFHGDVFFNYSGGPLQPDGARLTTGAIGRTDKVNNAFDLGFGVGGPIIKDKLWFYVGFNPAFTLRTSTRIISSQQADPANPLDYLRDAAGDPVQSEVARQSYDRNTRQMRFAAKLTFAPTPTQRIALSYFGNPSQTSGFLGTTVSFANASPSYSQGTVDFGTQNLTLSYQGKFADKKIQVEANAGYLRDVNDTLFNQQVMPWTRWQASPFQLPEPICRQDPTMRIPTCPTGGPEYFMGGGFNSTELAQRGAVAAKVSFFLPRNQIKVGADLEWNTFNSSFWYSGGQRERWRVLTIRDLDGDGIRDRELVRQVQQRGYVQRGPNDEVIRQQDVVLQKAFTRNLGFFLQDSWSILDNLTFNAGFRWEVQQVYGTAGPGTLADETDPTSELLNTVITLNKNVAPRAGIIWDPFKDGRTKVYGSFGVYYESIPANLGLRALGTTDVFAIDRQDFRNNQLQNFGFFGGHATGVAKDISPQYTFEWMAGIEREIIPSYRLGTNYIRRSFGNVIEDLSVDLGSNYFLANPGSGVKARGAGGLIERLRANPNTAVPDTCRYADFNADGSGNVDSLLCAGDFPEATRDYDAWTITFEKRRTEDQPWQFKFSYTLSFTRGNYPGLFYPVVGQDDPNLSQQFDLPHLLANRTGDLPNDRRHNLKLFGSYNFAKIGVPGLTIGLGFTAESGAPIRYTGADIFYGLGESYILAENAGRTPWIINADLFFEYAIKLGKAMRLSFNFVIFNFLNLQEALRVDQNYTSDAVCPLTAGQTLADLRQAVDIDLITQTCVPGDTPATQNPNFGRPIARQLPVSARLGVKLSF